MATKREELLGLTGSDVNWLMGVDADGGVVDNPPAPVRDGEGRVVRGCLGRAALDEPIFVIVAHDRCAPGAIRDWAERARKLGAPEAKWRGAMDEALKVEAWQAKYPQLVKDPD